MPPWQKRLADLAHLLVQCHHNYMEPEQFRRSVNQFLQTSRTVTFIIQKNKGSIPDFDGWYQENVLQSWKGDELMEWAKDARNTIEKEGDLDLYSSFSIRLFFGYIENEDLGLELDDPKLLHAGVKKLLRLAQKRLPSGVSRNAAVKVERRWVADTLPRFELLNAMCIIYRKVYDACSSLAMHLHHQIDEKTPRPAEFDDIRNQARQVRYFKLSSTKSFSMSTKRKSFRPGDIPEAAAAEIAAIANKHKEEKTIDGAIQWLSDMAEMTFNRDGYHSSMAFLYDSNWKPVDMVAISPEDATDKYIILRDLGERVRSMNAHGFAFICEAWLRKAVNLVEHPVSSQPIIGEQLQVVVLDRSGNYRECFWDIRRDDDTASLHRLHVHDRPKIMTPTFLLPILGAFGLDEHKVFGRER